MTTKLHENLKNLAARANEWASEEALRSQIIRLFRNVDFEPPVGAVASATVYTRDDAGAIASNEPPPLAQDEGPVKAQCANRRKHGVIKRKASGACPDCGYTGKEARP